MVPQNVDSPEAFARDLSEVRQKAGRSIRQVHQASDIPTATLGGYFAGRHLPPANRPEVLEAVLDACKVPRGKHSAWRRRLLALHELRRRGPATRAPYPGLRPFEESEQDLFFGREQLLDRFLGLLGSAADPGGPTVFMIVGPSGVGKSSFLRAGLQIAIGADRSTVCRPAESAGLLASLDGDDPDQSGFEHVFIVDQFEEVWTDLELSARSDELIDLLASWSEGSAGRVLVLGLRADFYGEAMRHPVLAQALQDRQLLVDPLAAESLRTVIQAPANEVGLTLEPGLVDVILADLRPDAVDSVLPQLAHVLDRMWRVSDRRSLTLESYRRVGGTEGAIRQSAEEALDDLPADLHHLAMSLLLRMVSSSTSRQWTRRVVPLPELHGLDPAAPTVLSHLIDTRLVTVGTEEATLSHEALLGAWPRLRELVETQRGDLARREALDSAAREWDEGQRSEDHLLRGSRLAGVEEWVATATEPLAPLHDEYLAESRRLAAKLRSDQSRARRWRRIGLVAMTVLALLTTLATVFAVDARNEAQDHLAQAQSRQLATASANVRDLNPSLSRQLGLAAYQAAPTREGRSALLDATTNPVITDWQVAGAQLERVAPLPGGERVVLAGPVGGLVVAEATQADTPWKVIGRLQDVATDAGVANVGRLAAHPVDPVVVAAGTASDPAEPMLVLVDVSDPTDPMPHPLDVAARPTAVTFAGGGSLLLVVDDQGDLHTYVRNSMLDWQRTGDAVAIGELVDVIATSADGNVVAAAMESGAVRVWRAEGGELRDVGQLATGRQLFSVALSADGAALAAVGRSGLVHWIDVGQDELTQTHGLYASDTNLFAVTIDSESQLLGAAGWDGSVSFWRWDEDGPQTESPSLVLPTPRPILDIAVSGDRWVFAGLEGTVFTWHSQGPALPRLAGNVYIVGASAAGDRYITSAGPPGGALSVWDASTPHEPVLAHTLAPEDEDASTGAGAISGDGRRAAMGTSEGRVLVWEVDQAEPELIVDEQLHLGSLIHVLLTADGSRAFAFSREGVVTALGLDGAERGVVLGQFEAEGATQTGAYGADGLIAVADTTSQVYLIDLEDPDPQVGRINLGVDAYGLEFSPQEDLLAMSLADNTIAVYDVSDPAHPVAVGDPVTGPTTVANSVKFSPDAQRIAVAAVGGQAWIYALDDQDWVPISVLRAGLVNLQDVAWSADGSVLLGGGLSGQTRLWLTDPTSAADAVCQKAGAAVSETEWASLIPGVAYQPPCGSSSD